MTTRELVDGIRNRVRSYASVQALKIETINGREYAIEGRRLTENGMERIDAYDLTAFDEIDMPQLRSLRDGNEVFIVYPDEGHNALVCVGGNDRWCGSWAVALSRDPQLRAQLMDELEASVDAGGSVNV